MNAHTVTHIIAAHRAAVLVDEASYSDEGARSAYRAEAA